MQSKENQILYAGREVAKKEFDRIIKRINSDEYVGFFKDADYSPEYKRELEIFTAALFLGIIIAEEGGILKKSGDGNA